MNYIEKDLGSYRLHMIKTDKFKTISVRVVFGSPIVKEEITMRNILCDMLLQSTKNYKTKRMMSIKSQDLYASEFATANTRLGNYINTNFYMNVLSDKYTEKDNFSKALNFFSEIIFNPDITNNSFDEKRLDIVKNNCKIALDTIKEDASSYSMIRMFESFGKSSPVAYRMQGYMEDLEKVDSKNLYSFYENMIKKDLVDIFVVGDFEENVMLSLIKENFKLKVLKKRRVPYLTKEIKHKNGILKCRETIDNSQSNLSVGCSLNNLTEYERNYPLTLFNIIFGGGSEAKLFREIREKYSLCYSIYSVPNKLDHLLIIQAGIDRENYKQVVDLIESNLNDMKKGKFTLKDIDVSKKYYETIIDELNESPDRIIDNYLSIKLLGIDDIDERLKKMKKVTKDEIIKVAKKVKINTLFLLEGVENEED